MTISVKFPRFCFSLKCDDPAKTFSAGVSSDRPDSWCWDKAVAGPLSALTASGYSGSVLLNSDQAQLDRADAGWYWSGEEDGEVVERGGSGAV